MTPEVYLKSLQSALQEAGHPETAEKQRRYLRDQFEHYGLKAPAWLAIAKEYFKTKGLFDGPELITFARLCMATEYRELHYIALEMVQKMQRKQPATFIDFLEELVLTNSWWDTVDWLAKLVGIHFKMYPELIASFNKKWQDSDDFWLIRISILFQLFYKEETNEELLYQNILNHSASQEFFIQKAAGWALRQYSKTNPESVEQFIAQHELAPLTVREGLKWIKKHRY